MEKSDAGSALQTAYTIGKFIAAAGATIQTSRWAYNALPEGAKSRIGGVVQGALNPGEWRTHYLAKYTKELKPDDETSEKQPFQVHGAAQRLLLDEVASCLTAGEKQNVVIYGPSGAGKSTLINGLVGHPTLEGRPILQLKLGELLANYKVENRVSARNFFGVLSESDKQNLLNNFRAILKELIDLQNVILYVDEAEFLFEPIEYVGDEARTIFSEFKETLAGAGPGLITAMTEKRFLARWKVLAEDDRRRWHDIKLKEWDLKQVLQALTSEEALREYGDRFALSLDRSTTTRPLTIESDAAVLFFQICDSEYKLVKEGQAIYPAQACDHWRLALRWFQSGRERWQPTRTQSDLKTLKPGVINTDAVRLFFQNQGFQRAAATGKPSTLLPIEIDNIERSLRVSKSQSEECRKVFTRLRPSPHTIEIPAGEFENQIRTVGDRITSPGGVVFLRGSSSIQIDLLVQGLMLDEERTEGHWYRLDLNQVKKHLTKPDLQVALFDVVKAAEREDKRCIFFISNADDLSELLDLAERQHNRAAATADALASPLSTIASLAEDVFATATGNALQNVAGQLGMGATAQKLGQALQAKTSDSNRAKKSRFPSDAPFTQTLIDYLGLNGTAAKVSIIAYLSPNASSAAVPAGSHLAALSPFTIEDNLKIVTERIAVEFDDTRFEEGAVLTAFHLTQNDPTLANELPQPDSSLRMLATVRREKIACHGQIASGRRSASGLFALSTVSSQKDKEKEKFSREAVTITGEDVIWHVKSKCPHSNIDRIVGSARYWTERMWRLWTVAEVPDLQSQQVELQRQEDGSQVVTVQLPRGSQPIEVPQSQYITAQLRRDDSPVVVVRENSMERRRLLLASVAAYQPVAELDLSALSDLSDEILNELVERQLPGWGDQPIGQTKKPVLCFHHHRAFEGDRLAERLQELACRGSIAILYFCSEELPLPISQMKLAESSTAQSTSTGGNLRSATRWLTGLDIDPVETIKSIKNIFDPGHPSESKESNNPEERIKRGAFPFEAKNAIAPYTLGPLTEAEVRGFANQSASQHADLSYDKALLDNLPEALRLMKPSEPPVTLMEIRSWIQDASSHAALNNNQISSDFLATLINRRVKAESTQDILDVLTPSVSRLPFRLARHSGNYVSSTWRTASGLVNTFLIKPLVILLPLLLVRKVYSRITAVADRLLGAI